MKCKIIGYDLSPLFNVYSWGHLCPVDLRFSNHIGSMLTKSAVDRGFEPWSGQTKNWRIGICYFFGNHTVLRSKSWWAHNLDNMSECSDISTWGLFQGASTIEIQLSMLVKIISLKCYLFLLWYYWKILIWL